MRDVRTSDDKLNIHRLTFEQRKRADALSAAVLDDPDTAAFELIFLRDRVKELDELTGPLIGQERK